MMPTSVSANSDAFRNYLKIATSPAKSRKLALHNLSNEQKASLIKVQYALQIVSNPQMPETNKRKILQAISQTSSLFHDESGFKRVAFTNRTISTPDELSQKILSDFPKKRDKDIALLESYQNLLTVHRPLRAALVKEMQIANRVGIWEAQLAYHLATGSFSTEQNEFIGDMIPKIRSILEFSATS